MKESGGKELERWRGREDGREKKVNRRVDDWRKRKRKRKRKRRVEESYETHKRIEGSSFVHLQCLSDVHHCFHRLRGALHHTLVIRRTVI